MLREKKLDFFVVEVWSCIGFFELERQICLNAFFEMRDRLGLSFLFLRRSRSKNFGFCFLAISWTVR